MNIISCSKNSGNTCTRLTKTRSDISFNAYGVVQTYYFIDINGAYVAPTEVVMGGTYALKSDTNRVRFFFRNIVSLAITLNLDIIQDEYIGDDIGPFLEIPGPYDYPTADLVGPDILPNFTMSQTKLMWALLSFNYDSNGNVAVSHYYEMIITTTKV